MSRNAEGTVQNNDLELWIKMLDSMANVLSASTSLIHFMYRDIEFPPDIPRNIYTGDPSLWSKNRMAELRRLYPDIFEKPVSTVRRNSSCNSINNLSKYLDDQCHRSKDAIARRYRTQNDLNTLFSKSNTMNETCPEGLSRISNMVTKSSPDLTSV